MSDAHAESGKKRDEDSEEGLDFSPFWGIEKGAVLQEARCFNESQLDARRCQQVGYAHIFSSLFIHSVADHLSF
jgi:coatomer protein complex subunit gamma